MLKNQNIGSIVASEMLGVLDSDEYRSLFRKDAKKKSDKDNKKEKNEACKCPKGCKCMKKGKHGALECSCPSPKKAQFNEVSTKLLSISDELENLGFVKASEMVLNSLDVLMSEASGADTIEELLEENPKLDVDITEALIKEPEGIEVSEDERLMGEEEEMSLEEQLKAIEEMGLEGEVGAQEKEKMQELGLSQKEIELSPGLSDELVQATREVDEWLQKYADEETLASLGTEQSDFELDADLKELLGAEEDLTDNLITEAISEEDEEFEDEE